MDHREYSSGGAEYFPTGREFSAPPGELPRPAPEITPPAAEADRSGSEYHETTQSTPRQQKKRRKNISPAMLTTAAVAVAVVTVAPLSSVLSPGSSGYSDAPTLTLSAQSREYLDGVMASLPQADSTQLMAMARDTRLRHLVVEEASDYIDQLIEYEDEHRADDYYRSIDGEEYDLQEGLAGGMLLYPGQGVLCSTFDSTHYSDEYLWFNYHRYSRADGSDPTHTAIHFYYEENPSIDASFHQAEAYIHYQDSDNGSRYESVQYENGQYRLVEHTGIENSYYAVLESGTSSRWHYSHNIFDDGTSYSDSEHIVAEGKFVVEQVSSDIPDYSYAYINYLYDGTITITWWDNYNDMDTTELIIPVEKGVTRLPDTVTVEQIQGGFSLVYRDPDNSGSYHSFAYCEDDITEAEYLARLPWYVDISRISYME